MSLKNTTWPEDFSWDNSAAYNVVGINSSAEVQGHIGGTRTFPTELTGVAGAPWVWGAGPRAAEVRSVLGHSGERGLCRGETATCWITAWHSGLLVKEPLCLAPLTVVVIKVPCRPGLQSAGLVVFDFRVSPPTHT